MSCGEYAGLCERADGGVIEVERRAFSARQTGFGQRCAREFVPSSDLRYSWVCRASIQEVS